MELTGKTAKTEKMGLKGLLDLQEPKGKQVPSEQMDVMDYPVHQERLVRRELGELPEAQDHQVRLVLKVNLK